MSIVITETKNKKGKTEHTHGGGREEVCVWGEREREREGGRGRERPWREGGGGVLTNICIVPVYKIMKEAFWARIC